MFAKLPKWKPPRYVSAFRSGIVISIFFKDTLLFMSSIYTLINLFNEINVIWCYLFENNNKNKNNNCNYSRILLYIFIEYIFIEYIYRIYKFPNETSFILEKQRNADQLISSHFRVNPNQNVKWNSIFMRNSISNFWPNHLDSCYQSYYSSDYLFYSIILYKILSRIVSKFLDSRSHISCLSDMR